MTRVRSLSVESDELVGDEGGFLAIRRMRLRNVREDDSMSAPYIVDFVARRKGIDAVVVAIYHQETHQGDDRVLVLLRDGLRPALTFGRDGNKPLSDPRPYLFFREVCAGILETDDRGETGIRERAAIEAKEEAGIDIAPGDVELLGAGTFPSPGVMPERHFFTAVRVADPSKQTEALGDGSPMEEGGVTMWVELQAAIDACVAGDIEDAKTELCLRRLRDRLCRETAD